MFWRAIYSLGLYLLLPAVLWRLWWRGRGHPGYRQRIAERFGCIELHDDNRPLLWLHAVSVGEVQAAAPIVRELLERHASYRVLVTTTTPTGAEHAQRQFGAAVSHAYFPFDTPDAVMRALRRTRPALMLVMETELWPNLIHACAVHCVPVLLLNARMSARSHARYQRMAPLVRLMLNELHGVAAQTQADADRLIDLGLPRGRVTVTGSVKFDQPLPPDIDEQVRLRRQICAAPRPIWIAASTHSGEEAMVIAAHRQVLDRYPLALLVLAPRHPVRVEEIIVLIQRAGLQLARRSRGEQCDAGTQVLLLDTLGELLPFYGAADIAFVGGSLVPTGGHNMLEPAALGVPVLFGPHTFNFERIAGLLCEAGAAEVVNGAEALAGEVMRLLGDETLRRHRGGAARAVIDGNDGGLAATMQLIDAAIASRCAKPIV